MTPQAQHAFGSPIPAGQRIHALDVLRGFALWGVLVSNLNDWYGAPDPTTPLDKALAWGQAYLVESRFMTLFCLLFGIGFSIQLVRATERGGSFLTLYRRRLLALLGIGLVHGLLIWHGDILADYALVGFFLLLFRDASRKALLWAIVICTVVLPYLRRGIFATLGIRMVPIPSWDFHNWIYAHGSFRMIAEQRIQDWLNWHQRWPFGVYLWTLSLFLFGLYIGKSGILHNLLDHVKLIRRALLVSIVVAGAGYAVGALYHPRVGGPWSLQPVVAGLAEDAATYGLAGVYATSLLLLLRNDWWARRLSWLGGVGRMALTNYLTQSIVSTLCFYHFGLGWFGKATYTDILIFSAILFAVQIVLSRWWLRRFRFGPAEWLWRSLTYGERQPMQLAG